MPLRPVDRIADARDPRIAAYRDVGDPELVRARGLFVAEGRLVVRRVIGDRRYRIRSLLVNDATMRDLAALIDTLDPAVPVYVCGTSDFLGITGFDIHRGCLALVERPTPTSMAEALAGARTAVVLEGVTNPDNVGGVFRSAAAFGAGAVILSPTTCDPFYRKAIRTSMGAALRVPFARADAWPGALSHIHRAGFTIVALTPREPSVSISEWQAGLSAEARSAKAERAGIALLVGTEGAGLSADAESLADVRIRIPTTGAVDSLNLSVAAGIALFALSGYRF